MIHAKPHIHYVDDGRPPRRVYLNGLEVPRAVFADTKRGIVSCFHDVDKPLNHYLLRKGEIRRITMSGKVRVKTIART